MSTSATPSTIVPPPDVILKFLTANHSAPTGSGRYTLNRWRSVSGVLVPCQNGLHATTADNLLPFLDAQLWRVEIGDEWVWHTDSQMGRKLVARRMRIVERVETWNDRTARLFAADCAERVLPLFEAEHPTDTRPRQAIETARRYANGEATAAELAAARDAASATARDAASAAASATACATARDAASAAACATARDAASAAASATACAAASAAASATACAAASAAASATACAAARDAAWATACAAARDAASAAEHEWQARRLCEMLGLVYPESEVQP